MKKPLRVLYIALGFLFVGLGALGVFLPVLPTTPFLLLASFFFSKGSKRFEQWFIGTKLYKEHLEEFLKDRSMKLNTKVKLLSFSSMVLLLSAYLVNIIYVRIFIALVIVYKYYYFIFRIKTITEPKEGKAPPAKEEKCL
jgi:uncharacterized membrane protein YbaN (DUF454 family)